MNQARQTAIVRISIFLIAFVFSQQAHCQWQKISVGATQDLTDVSPVSGDTLFLAGFEGMFKTVNAGATWTNLPIDAFGSYFYKTRFFNSKTGIGVGPILMANTEVIAKTVNSGVNWSMVSVQNGGNWPREFNDLDFPNITIGYAAGRNGRVLKTTNAGDTWSPIVADGVTNYLGVSFDAANHGYLVSRHWLQETNGTSIVRTVLVSSEADFLDVHALSASELILLSSTKLRRTTNSGTTWTTYDLPFNSVTCMFVYSSQIIYLGTEHGLYVTKDGGSKWEFFKETKTAYIESVHIGTNGLGFIAAREGVVFKTANSGGTPSPVVHFDHSTQGNCNYTTLDLTNKTNPSYPFKWLLNDDVVSTDFHHSIKFTEAFSGTVSLIVGSGPSADTLTQQVYLDVQNVYANAGNDLNVCYNEPVKLNASGSFYYSWSPTTGLSDPNIANPVSVYPGTIEYVVSVSNDHGCVDTDTVTVYRATTIPTEPWSRTDLTTASPVERMHMLNDELGYAIAGNKVLFTEDAGLHWTDHSTLPGRAEAFTNYNDIQFVTPDIGYVVSRFLYMTKDGGQTYTETAIHPSLAGIFDIQFVNSMVGYAAVNISTGEYSTIHKTIDGGETWEEQFGLYGQIYKLTVLPNGTCIAVGNDGMIGYGAFFARTTDGEHWEKATYSEIDYHTVYDVNFVDNLTGYAVSMNSKVWKTEDGGASWFVIYTLPDWGKSIKFKNNDVGFIGTYNGAILQTTNGGQCWQNMGTVHTTWIEEIHLYKDLAFFASGETVFENGVIFRRGIQTPTSLSQTISFPALGTKTVSDESFSLTAVASSGLPVSYSSSNNAVATVSGNIVTIVGIGTTTIQATQTGNSVFSAAPAISRTLQVSKANQTITFNTPSPKTIGDAPFSLSASATSGLPVSFSASNNAIATVNGSTVTIHAAGSVTITAAQAGNSHYNAGTAVVRTLIISKQNQVISFESLTPRSLGSAPFTLNANANSGLAVTYSSDNSAVATLSGNVVTITGAGSATITAAQAGNLNYNPAPSVSQILVVSNTILKIDQTIAFNAVAQHTVGDPDFLLIAVASSGLPVTFSSSNTSVVTVDGNTVKIIGGGTTLLSASQGGNIQYNAAPTIVQVLTVKKLSQSINFESIPEEIETGTSPFSLNATATSGLAVTFTSSDVAVLLVNANECTVVDEGTATITATQSGSSLYDPATPVSKTVHVMLLTANEPFEEREVSLYPNPVIDWMYIKMGEFVSAEPVHVTITDSFARSIVQTSSEGNDELPLNLELISPGVYYLHLTQGKKRIQTRFVKL